MLQTERSRAVLDAAEALNSGELLDSRPLIQRLKFAVVMRYDRIAKRLKKTWMCAGLAPPNGKLRAWAQDDGSSLGKIVHSLIVLNLVCLPFPRLLMNSIALSLSA